MINKVIFCDSDGKTGWRSRTGLGLQLSEADKFFNKDAKKLNPKLPKGKKIPLITPKHLACRFVNKQFKLNLDVDKCPENSDEADAIGLGYFYLTKVLKR